MALVIENNEKDVKSLEMVDGDKVVTVFKLGPSDSIGVGAKFPHLIELDPKVWAKIQAHPVVRNWIEKKQIRTYQSVA